MKDLIFYHQEIGRKNVFENREYSLKELTGRPGVSVPGVPSIGDVVKEGKLKLVGDVGDYRMFNFACKYLASHGETNVEIERTIELWQSKTGALVVSGFPNRAARVGIALLSLATFGDPDGIGIFSPITKNNFIDIKKCVMAEDGTVISLDVQGVSWGGGTLKHLMMKGKKLEDIPGFDGVLENAKKVVSMGFSFPYEPGRNISFRMVDWGGGQIYSNVQTHEMAKVLALVEESLIHLVK
jgi:hypothetical protein